jgi:ketosteroid isomerase-like protein
MTMDRIRKRFVGRPGLALSVVLAGVLGAGGVRQGWGQIGLPGGGQEQSAPNPLMDPTAKPGKVLLFDLEARFAKDTKERGGAGFASWFAEDGVALGNGQPPVIGRVAIEKSARAYQLTWTPTDAQMGPSGDMGYTWGRFEGRSKDASGNPVVTSGRYMTIWRKQGNGSWKVVLDAGANEPAAAGDCCKLPNSWVAVIRQG